MPTKRIIFTVVMFAFALSTLFVRSGRCEEIVNQEIAVEGDGIAKEKATKEERMARRKAHHEKMKERHGKMKERREKRREHIKARKEHRKSMKETNSKK